MSSSSVSRHPRVIFIGNIPFEITEEQLIDIFKEVGPVLSFRLMFDRETGRSRGYAFCEYSDPETAASAIRNLSGYEIGGRHLKVDKADNDMLPSVAGGSVLGSGSGFGGGSSGGGKEQQRSSSSYDNQSSQIPLPNIRPIQNILNIPSTASTTAIHSILTSPPFTNPQTLLDLLTSLKTTIQNNPEQARHLLAGNPALSYALLQSFISLNLIDMSTVQVILIYNLLYTNNFLLIVIINSIPTGNPTTPITIPTTKFFFPTSTSTIFLLPIKCRTSKSFYYANHVHDTGTNKPFAPTTA